MTNNLHKKVIIALDLETFSEAKNLVDLLGERIDIYKVGLESYLNFGKEIIDYLNSKNKKIFLDLKFNDISNTTLQACKWALKNKFFIFNVHATIGTKALCEISKLCNEYDHDFIFAAVTVLTSFDQNEYTKTFGNNLTIEEAIKYYVNELIVPNNLKAIVCSSLESIEIKKLHPHIITICPGIRLNASLGDQKRVLAPSQALNNNVDYLVIGREVNKAPNPIEALELIFDDIDNNCIVKKGNN
ncbi:MAG: orotidine-5'-phosphate decarboxylase [Mycoplasma sp.]